ncbi:MAG: ABC transporter ATP-binding protein [Gemmatimonadetes bacterium]|nr:ABC transporter ATP-binding protein [Gemmatimonadota bacterium]MBT7862316.1 ABC transporter ATP-binding protein [Gemmatimonadota bacterium]
MATPPPIDEAAIRGRIDLRLLGRLLAYLQPYGGWVALTLALILLSSLARQAGPYLTKIAVDDHMMPGQAEGFGQILVIFVGLLVIQFILGYMQSWATNMIGQWTMRDVRLQIFQHLQRLPLRYFDRTPVGRLMARNTSDVDALNELFTDGVVSLFSETITVVSILGFIFYMDVQLGWLTCICLPISFIATSWLQRRTYGAYREARTLFARFAASLQESISGIDVVQLFGCEARRAQAMDDANDQYLEARLTSSFYHCAYFPMMELSGGIMLALVLWVGTGRVLQEEMAWGVLVAMMQYVPRFFMPLRDIAERFNTLQIAMASSERIFEILDSAPEPTGQEAPSAALQGSIEFRDVWFAYDEQDWVLRDVSFTVDPGQSLALVGATGAGKSTVIGLLCRFYDVQRGAVLVDGVDVRDWNVRDLRRRIGLVQQDVYLFAGTIGSNIALGVRDADDEQIRSAAVHANADRFITHLPLGYDEPVGERGANLSTGQRQLLSFARVLAAEPEILVLDEATASVDTETEMWIQEAVARLMSQRTSVVIAHRLSTIQSADNILVLHRGKVREQGRHDQLLARKGIYARLHGLQYTDAGENSP